MEEKKSKQPKKLSYEDLENAARQISEQARAFQVENKQLREKIQQLQMGNVYTELGFKFKVVELASSFSSTFVRKITDEIEEIMTIVPEEETENKDGEGENK